MGKIKEKKETDKPEEGKVYALTGAAGTACIANGNTWKEAEVKDGQQPVAELEEAGGQQGGSLTWLLVLVVPLVFYPRAAGWIYILLLTAVVRGCTGIT